MNSDEMSVLSTILNHHQSAQPLLAVLVDPDKRERYSALLSYLGDVDLVLVGGSTGTQIEECVMELRHHTSAPLVLFPGNTAQFTPMAVRVARSISSLEGISRRHQDFPSMRVSRSTL